MTILVVNSSEKRNFNQLASHPLQSWEWGDFRQKTGNEIVRLGLYEKDKLIETVQMTIHRIPHTGWKIGYIPKSKWPSAEICDELIKIGKKNSFIFIKLEPNIEISPDFKFQISNFKLVQSPHPLFTRYTFQLDLTKSEDELLREMHPKTRYNIKVAMKNRVVIKRDDSPDAFRKYLDLTMETTNRQGFYAHDRKYHETMWETLKSHKSKVKSQKSELTAYLFTASYIHEGKNNILVTWIVFLFNNILYYPYGASSGLFRNAMASNLMMWEVIKWGKKNGAKLFDLWGSLGPNPDPKDPWYGFHRFKEGYHPKLVEFIGSYDLIINQPIYRLYNYAYYIRQLILKIKSKI